MAKWNTENNEVSRATAIEEIQSRAKEQGITGSFKVFYNGAMIATPDELPETVNLDLIKVSAMLNNA